MSPPFIEAEMVVKAYWWNHPGHSFLYKIFDPTMNDGEPGRFRYVDYLAEALYWELTRLGVLPRDLYDYFAIAFNLIVAGLLYGTARCKSLSRLTSFLIPAAFLLSCHVFHTTLFHYRKAKMIVSIEMLLLIWLFSLEEGRKRFWAILSLSGLGVLTDPYFILIAPLLLLVTEGKAVLQRTDATRAMGLGFVASGVIILLLNGVIGPQFNPNCALIPPTLHDTTGTLLTPLNSLRFLLILPDLLAPVWVMRAPIVAWGWTLLVVVAFSSLVVRYKSQTGLTFLLSLPLMAFLLKPAPEEAVFSGYYGHALLVLFLVALMEILARTGESNLVKALTVLFFAVTLGLHQSAKEDAYVIWRMGHLEKQVTAQKFWNDYEELVKIDLHVKSKSAEPYLFRLDVNNYKTIKMEAVYEKNETGHERKHTTLAYLLVPSLFREEILSGKIKVVPD